MSSLRSVESLVASVAVLLAERALREALLRVEQEDQFDEWQSVVWEQEGDSRGNPAEPDRMGVGPCHGDGECDQCTQECMVDDWWEQC